MRRLLSSEQRRRVEELVQEKGETCGLCGNVVLRCDEDAAPYLGGMTKSTPAGTAWPGTTRSPPRRRGMSWFASCGKALR